MRSRSSSVLSVVSFLVAVLGAFAVHGDPLSPVTDNGFVTPVHEKNVGKIVFAKTTTAVTTPEKPAEFVDKLALSDSIWFRAYLPRSFENAFRAQGTECRKSEVFRIFDAWVDGKKVVASDDGFYLERLAPESFQKGTSIRFDEPLNGKAKADEKSPWAAFATQIVPTLTPGSHKLKLVITGACETLKFKYVRLEKPEAEGEITLEVSDKDVAAAAKSGPQLPAAGMKDDKLQKDMAALMKKEWPKDEILRVVIASKTWKVETFKGHPVARRVDTAVAVKQGTKCKYFDVTFVQQATGKTTWAATQYDSVGDMHEIACSAAK